MTGFTSLTVIDETDSPIRPSIPSLLDKLRALTKSELARKCRVAFNPPRDGKRYKCPKCVSDPKSIPPEMRVKSYLNECFVVSAGKLFCTACREELCVKVSVLRLHVKCAKHNQGKVCLECKEKRKHDIVAAMKAYDDAVQPKGETLPVKERVYCVKCVRTFLKMGVPLNKLDVFRELLEENEYWLRSRKIMCDLIPLIIHDGHEPTKKEISGQQLSIIFDCTS